MSQEDLAKLLMSDVRTIRRDIAELKRQGIIVPTRGTVKDIGPGVTHKEIAIRLWLEGLEPTEVARRIHHSIKATENYLEKFKRVAYLRREKGFTVRSQCRISHGTGSPIHDSLTNASSGQMALFGHLIDMAMRNMSSALMLFFCQLERKRLTAIELVMRHTVCVEAVPGFRSGTHGVC